MTVRGKLVANLISMGMSSEQGNSVMDKAAPELQNTIENYNITFDSHSSEYPDVIYDVLFMAIKPIALKWIDDNKPHAWFRPMFV